METRKDFWLIQIEEFKRLIKIMEENQLPGEYIEAVWQDIRICQEKIKEAET